MIIWIAKKYSAISSSWIKCLLTSKSSLYRISLSIFQSINQCLFHTGSDSVHEVCSKSRRHKVCSKCVQNGQRRQPHRVPCVCCCCSHGILLQQGNEDVIRDNGLYLGYNLSRSIRALENTTAFKRELKSHLLFLKACSRCINVCMNNYVWSPSVIISILLL